MRVDTDHAFPCVAKVSIKILPNTRLDTSRDDEANAVAEIRGRLIGKVEMKLEGCSRRLTPGDVVLWAPISTALWRYERALEEAGDYPSLPKPETSGRKHKIQLRSSGKCVQLGSAIGCCTGGLVLKAQGNVEWRFAGHAVNGAIG